MSGSTRGFTLAVAVAVSLSAQLVAAPSAPCAGSHGDYSGWYDPQVECRVDVASADYLVINAAIESLFHVCYAEYFHAFNQASWAEWTGYYEDADGWYLNDVIGLRYDVMGSAWMWAHEAAHGLGANEAQADARANECTQVY